MMQANNTAQKLMQDEGDGGAPAADLAVLHALPASPQKPVPGPVLLGFFSAVFCLLLLIPIIQFMFRPFPIGTLNGLPEPASFPVLTKKAVLKETFQKQAEEWILKKTGLWAHLVRASNQLSYSLFNQISSSYGTTILAGKDGHLFQPMYVPAFNRSKAPNPAALESRVRKIRTLQDMLARHGTSLIVLISTNAIALYPEIVPAGWTDPRRLERPNSYDLMRPMLDEHGVNYVDMHEYFRRYRDRSPVPLFQPTASHWNDFAACLATQALIDKIAQLTAKPIKHLECGSYEIRTSLRAADLDLLDIANLLFPAWTHLPAPYVMHRRTEAGEQAGFRPDILFVGSSYVFSVLEHLETAQVSKENHFYFYYRQTRDPKSGSLYSLSTEAIRWPEQILSKDVIVLEGNQAAIGQMGLKFLDDALANIAAIPAGSPEARRVQ